MKFLIIGFYSCMSHQVYDFIKEDNIIPELRLKGIPNHFSYFKFLFLYF